MPATTKCTNYYDLLTFQTLETEWTKMDKDKSKINSSIMEHTLLIEDNRIPRGRDKCRRGLAVLAGVVVVTAVVVSVLVVRLPQKSDGTAAKSTLSVEQVRDQDQRR